MKHTIFNVTGADTLIQIMALVNGMVGRDAERNKGRGIKTAVILPLPFAHHFFESEHVSLLSYDPATQDVVHGLNDVRGNTYHRIIQVAPLGGLDAGSKVAGVVNPLLASNPDVEFIQFTTLFTRSQTPESLHSTRFNVTKEGLNHQLELIRAALVSRAADHNLLVLPYDALFTESDAEILKTAYENGKGTLTVVRYYKDGPEGDLIHIDRSKYRGQTFDAAFFVKQPWMHESLQHSIGPTLLGARLRRSGGGQLFIYDVAAQEAVEA